MWPNVIWRWKSTENQKKPSMFPATRARHVVDLYEFPPNACYFQPHSNVENSMEGYCIYVTERPSICGIARIMNCVYANETFELCFVRWSLLHSLNCIFFYIDSEFRNNSVKFGDIFFLNRRCMHFKCDHFQMDTITECRNSLIHKWIHLTHIKIQ